MKLLRLLLICSFINLFLVISSIGVVNSVQDMQNNLLLEKQNILNKSNITASVQSTKEIPSTQIEKIKTTEKIVTTTNSNLVPTLAPTTVQKLPTCLIKIDSSVYDLIVFRNQHSGGDIFQCGSDMTIQFYKQHSSNYLKVLEKYRIQ